MKVAFSTPDGFVREISARIPRPVKSAFFSAVKNPVLHPMKLRKIGEKEVYFYTSLW